MGVRNKKRETLRPANANSIRVFFGLDTLNLKFSAPEMEVSKVHSSSGGGGVVRFHRPTSLFFSPLLLLSLRSLQHLVLTILDAYASHTLSVCLVGCQ